jgi:hypothetical protein
MLFSLTSTLAALSLASYVSAHGLVTEVNGANGTCLPASLFTKTLLTRCDCPPHPSAHRHHDSRLRQCGNYPAQHVSWFPRVWSFHGADSIVFLLLRSGNPLTAEGEITMPGLRGPQLNPDLIRHSLLPYRRHLRYPRRYLRKDQGTLPSFLTL